MLAARAAAWASQELKLRAFEHAAEILTRSGVPIVPVKGIALARWLYTDVVDRPMMDVDLFVPRSAWAAARTALIAHGPTHYESSELSELAVRIDGVSIELHGEVGRRELTRLSVDEMVSRASLDTQTFRFPVLRLDDVDHLILMVCNAIKDGFVFARRHVPEDLTRLLATTSDRTEVLLERTREAGLTTGLYCTAQWMVEEHGSVSWNALLQRLAPPPRPAHARLMRAFRRSRWPKVAVAVGLTCLTNDAASLRRGAVTRIIRRNLIKLMGRRPP